MGKQKDMGTVLAPSKGTYAIGIDPGFTELGLVLADKPTNIVNYSTWTSPPGDWSVARACSMAEVVIACLEDWIQVHAVRTLGISIETPIYAKHPVNFSKQWRLIQELESCIMFRADAWGLDRCILIEYGPTESKRIATGNGSATKVEVFCKAPIPDRTAMVLTETVHTQNTVGDAWAHSLAVWTPDVGSRIDVSKLVALNIQQLGRKS